jgi:hypothetical protein
MGTKFQDFFCDEHGIGGSGEYFGDNDTHLDITSFLYHEASGGKYVPRAEFSDLKPGVIGAVRASSLGCLFCPGDLVGEAWPKTTTKEFSTISSDLPPKFSSPFLRFLHDLTSAERTRVYFHPQYQSLCHFGLY